MKLKCPDCGRIINIERLSAEGAFRQIIDIYKSLLPVEAYLVSEYVECFRASAHVEMPTKKYLRILNGVVDLLDAGTFDYNKFTYRIDRELALEAMQKTVDTEKRSFRNHNYWKVIMVGLLKKRGAIEEQQAEDAKRDTSDERRATSKPERVGMPRWVKEKIYGEEH